MRDRLTSACKGQQPWAGVLVFCSGVLVQCSSLCPPPPHLSLKGGDKVVRTMTMRATTTYARIR